MLTDAAARAAKPKERPYKLPDGGGLHLFVTPAGGRLWRLRYQVDGREKLISLGPYPAVTLARAREERDAAKTLLRAGRDPGVEKKARQAATAGDAAGGFEAVARE